MSLGAILKFLVPLLWIHVVVVNKPSIILSCPHPRGMRKAKKTRLVTMDQISFLRIRAQQSCDNIHTIARDYIMYHSYHMNMDNREMKSGP